MAGIHFGRWISIAYLIFKVGRAGAAMEIVAFPKAQESANEFYRHRLKGLCVPVCPVKKFCVSRCVPRDTLNESMVRMVVGTGVPSAKVPWARLLRRGTWLHHRMVRVYL